MLVYVVARRSLANSAAGTRTGGTMRGAAFPGDSPDPLNVVASTAAPAAATTAPATTACRTWPTQNRRTAELPSSMRPGRPRLMRRNQSRVSRLPWAPSASARHWKGGRHRRRCWRWCGRGGRARARRRGRRRRDSWRRRRSRRAAWRRRRRDGGRAETGDGLSATRAERDSERNEDGEVARENEVPAVLGIGDAPALLGVCAEARRRYRHRLMERDLVVGPEGSGCTQSCDRECEDPAGHYDTAKPCHHAACPDTEHRMPPKT